MEGGIGLEGRVFSLQSLSYLVAALSGTPLTERQDKSRETLKSVQQFDYPATPFWTLFTNFVQNVKQFVNHRVETETLVGWLRYTKIHKTVLN